ncbi:RusA family crossover junction endodeoxyribonuclease [Streptomyces hirsutus]|uniref:RusA family crossover junction endodeoxyribonuclease n=1 Tax=Streptomyces hirsutus TaxID=35620 RepID=UPI00363F5E13
MTGLTDRARGEQLMQLLAPGASTSWGLVIPGEPATKSRPRFGNGRTYKLEKDEEAEKATAWHLRRRFRQPLTGNVALGCVFFRPDMRLIDVDNMIKHVCDAANGVVWVDDSQVTAVYGQAELDVDEPRTLVVVAPHMSTLLRGTDNVRDCAGCGKPFTPSHLTQKCCSRDCVAEARRLRGAVRS